MTRRLHTAVRASRTIRVVPNPRRSQNCALHAARAQLKFGGPISDLGVGPFEGLPGAWLDLDLNRPPGFYRKATQDKQQSPPFKQESLEKANHFNSETHPEVMKATLRFLVTLPVRPYSTA